MSRGGGHSARRGQSQHDAGYRDQSVTTGPQARPAAAARGRPRLTLNDDGQRHPMENSLSLFTLVAGLVACVLGFLANQTALGPGRMSERRGSG